MQQFFNNYRNKKLLLPVVTQRAYAWLAQQMLFFLNKCHDHALKGTDYYLTSITVREIDDTYVKVSDGGNRSVTYVIAVAALVNFCATYREELLAMYGEELMLDLECKLDQYRRDILWSNERKREPRIWLEDEDDMRALMYCLQDDARIGGVTGSNIVDNYKVAFCYLVENHLTNPAGLSLWQFMADGLDKVTTIIEECQSEEEENEVFFIKNAGLGVRLQDYEILGSVFNSYIRKYVSDEAEIRRLQARNREVFLRLKVVLNDKALLTKNYKKSFFTMFSYYIGVKSGKNLLLSHDDVSVRMEDYIKEVLDGRVSNRLFGDVESLIDTLAYFIEFAIKVVRKDFSSYKYSYDLLDMPFNSTFMIWCIDLLSNKYDVLLDEDRHLFFKFGKKLFLLNALTHNSAHPENYFCNIVDRCVGNAERNGTSLVDEVVCEFNRQRSIILSHDVSDAKVKSLISDWPVYVKHGISRLIIDEVNEVLDKESRLRPFCIPNNDVTIEHMCPQSLYENHPNLHKLGALCLISKRTNSTFSNTANWSDKYETYLNTPWMMNEGIREFRDRFTLGEEFERRHDFLCDAFVEAMKISLR